MKRWTVFAVLLTLAGTVAVPNATAATAPFDVMDEDLERTIEIQVSPHVLILGLQGEWVTIHTDIKFSEVAPDSLTLNDVPVSVAFADNRGYLVAKFDQATIQEIVAPPTATLTLVGCTRDGVPLSGAETIAVNETGKK